MKNLNKLLTIFFCLSLSVIAVNCNSDDNSGTAPSINPKKDTIYLSLTKLNNNNHYIKFKISSDKLVIDWGDGFIKNYETGKKIEYKYDYNGKPLEIKEIKIYGENLTYFSVSDFHPGNENKINLTKNPNLEYLSCQSSSLKELNVDNNLKLKYLDCTFNEIKNLDVSKNINLEELIYGANFGGDNLLTIGKNENLKILSCNDNYLKNLDVTGLPNLKVLEASFNNFSKLDISNNKLEKLDISNNSKIQELDVTNKTDLKILSCNNTGITKLDLSRNAELQSFSFSNTKISSLDLSKNKKLQYLNMKINYDFTEEAFKALFESLPVFKSEEVEQYGKLVLPQLTLLDKYEEQLKSKGWYIFYN